MHINTIKLENIGSRDVFRRRKNSLTPPVEKYFRNFGPVEKYFFAKNEDFSKIFEILIHRSPQKSLFIAFLLTNFPNISKKVLKNFSRRLRRRKRVEIPQFFDPQSVDGPPPLEGSPPM